MADDWYRKTSWTTQDQADFCARLKRAKAYNRAQYLRIQAVTLYRAGDKSLLPAVIALTRKCLTDYPEARVEKAAALQLLGDAYQLLSDVDSALDYYAQAIAFEDTYPNAGTTAWLDYAELTVKTDRRDLFDRAEQILMKKTAVFPVYRYRYNALLCILRNHRGDTEQALYYREQAEIAAAATTSEFRNHPRLGLVSERDEALETLMRQCTAETQNRVEFQERTGGNNHGEKTQNTAQKFRRAD